MSMYYYHSNNSSAGLVSPARSSDNNNDHTTGNQRTENENCDRNDNDIDSDGDNNRRRSSSWSKLFETKHKKKKKNLLLLKKGSIPAASTTSTNLNLYDAATIHDDSARCIVGRKRDSYDGSANTLKIGNLNLAFTSSPITGTTATVPNNNDSNYTHNDVSMDVGQKLDREGEEILLLENAAGFPHNLSPANSEVMDIDNTNTMNNVTNAIDNGNNIQHNHYGNAISENKKNDDTPRISGSRRNDNNSDNNNNHGNSRTQSQRLGRSLHLNQHQRQNQHRRSQSLGTKIRMTNLAFPVPSLSISNDTTISSLSDATVNVNCDANEINEKSQRLQGMQEEEEEEWKTNENNDNTANQTDNDNNDDGNSGDDNNNEDDDDNSSDKYNEMNMDEGYPPNFNNVTVIDTAAVTQAAAVAIAGGPTSLMASSTASITDETLSSATGVGREYLTNDYYGHIGGGGENGLVRCNYFDNADCDDIENVDSKKNFIVYTNGQNNYREDENRRDRVDIDESNNARGAGADAGDYNNNQLHSYNNSEHMNSFLQSLGHQHPSNHHHSLNSNELLRLNSNDNDYDMKTSVNSKSLAYSNSNDYSYVQQNRYSNIPAQEGRDNHSGHDQQMTRNNEPMGYIESFLKWVGRKFCWFCPRPSWSRVSSAVVRYAPCFCCADKLETSATDRMLLTRLNILCAIMSLGQFAVGVFILIVFLSEAVVDRELGEEDQILKEALTPNLWMMSGCLLILSVVGFFTFCTMIVMIPKIKQVNLDAAIRFMWILYWVLPLQILFVIALFDYHQVTEVWIKHWWSGPSMAWFRGLFCEEGTANGKCAIPLKGVENSKTWCEMNHNATDCIEIRKAAIDRMESTANFFIYTNAIAGAVLIILLLLALGLLEGIISAPIVQRSKESNISLWLTFPIIGSLAGGAALLYTPKSLISSESGADLQLIGLCYLVTGATFTISALLGWFISAKTVLNLRDKTQKEIAVYLFIFMLILAIFAVGSVFAVSLVFTLNIVKVGMNDESRGEIACFIDAAASCSCCEIDEIGTMCPKKCPEWQTRDVVRIIQTQLKQSATLAAIFFLYAFSALRFGFSLRASVSKYEIDYV